MSYLEMAKQAAARLQAARNVPSTDERNEITKETPTLGLGGSASYDINDITTKGWRPTSCDVCHWWGERGERETHWDAATQRWICSRCRCSGPAPRYAPPWPDEIEGLGLRHVDAFAPCSNCETGTWVRYGRWALCLACSNLGRPQS
jgi:hypothetical protein